MEMIKECCMRSAAKDICMWWGLSAKHDLQHGFPVETSTEAMTVEHLCLNWDRAIPNQWKCIIPVERSPTRSHQ
jgi:hypothetical protein